MYHRPCRSPLAGDALALMPMKRKEHRLLASSCRLGWGAYE